jgi:abortive infection bacteriophage resistance protein
MRNHFGNREHLEPCLFLLILKATWCIISTADPPSLSIFKAIDAEIGGYSFGPMRYTKPALIFNDQLALIESRGLAIPSKDRALRWLRTIGYYRLSAYFLPFKVPLQDQFQPGATFDQIVSLYKFDADLRLLVMQAIDRIEIAIQTAVTYQLAHTLGPFGYTDPANFVPFTPPSAPGLPPRGLDHNQFMGMLQREVEKSEEVFVRHFKGKYTSEPHLPVWMATELMTFGTVARLHENSRKSLRKQIGKGFGVSQSQITSWINSLTYIRNVCAHHARLWNREISVKPELTSEWKQAGVKAERIYCIFLVIEKVLSCVAPQNRWKDRIMAHILNAPWIDRGAMQFPNDWLMQAPWNSSVLLPS